MGKSISFEILEENWYTYEIADGTILKFRFHLKALTRGPFGNFVVDGITDSQVQGPSVGMRSFEPERFPDPKWVHLGSNKYLTGEKETVNIRPTLLEVVRSFDSGGKAIYNWTLHWVPDLPLQKVVETSTRSSTFASVVGSRESIVEATVRHREVLQWLFPTSWFFDPKNKNHPAALEWNMCNNIIQWNGFIPDSVSLQDMHFAAKVSLDATLLITLSQGDIRRLIPGRLEALGDASTRRKVTSRIGDPESYEDLFVEMYTAGWHKSKAPAREVSMLETEGYPDVRVKIPSLEFPIYIECKRLKVNKSSRIHDVIRDADRKFTRAGEGVTPKPYGAVLLDLATVAGRRHQTDESIPPEIVVAMKEVLRVAGSDVNSHVHSVVVVWDDFNVFGRLPEPVQVTFRRRAKVYYRRRSPWKLPIDYLFNGCDCRLLFGQVPDELRNPPPPPPTRDPYAGVY